MTDLEKLFKEALAWGMAYGPALVAEQWHMLSDEQAKKFAARATPPAAVVSDAGITACALMIKGVCMTIPRESWTKDIEERIRFMLAAPAQPTAQGTHCINCGMSIDPRCACERGRAAAHDKENGK